MPFPILPSNSASGYFLTKSLRFRRSASAYLSRTPSTAGNRKTWTYSVWFKRGLFGGDVTLLDAGRPNNPWTAIYFSADANNPLNSIAVATTAGASDGTSTAAVFRDPSAWYHLVVAMDTTQATASDRVKIYINGVLQTLSYTNYPAQNYDTYVNSTASHSIGALSNGGAGNWFDGYMEEINLIDGQALTPSSFGSYNSLTGVWQPAKYSGTYGTNGFYLPFTTTTSTSTLGNDFSGNGNNWTTNNFSLTAGSNYDSMNDVPTLTSATTANYCVLNPLRSYSANTVSNGNLNILFTDPSSSRTTYSTFGLTSGKWYWEATITNGAGGYYPGVGVNTDLSYSPSNQSGDTASGFMYLSTGQKFNNGSLASYGSSYTTNDVIGVSLDMDAGTITFYKNNTSQGQAYSGITGTAVPCFIGDANASCAVNFGQQPFTYTPPTGFVALNTYNLPTSTIVKGNTVMDATIWTGTGVAQNIVNSGSMQPDFVWIKARNQTYDNQVWDSVRGPLLKLATNNTSAESSLTNSVTGFNSNGIALGDTATVNLNGGTFVGWQWQAGQGSTSTNTSGSLTSTVSVNATAGFSVVTYSITNASATISTFGHGLGIAPSMVILKVRNAVDEWTVYHSGISNPNNNWLTLNTGNAAGNGTSTFSSSSSTFGVRETRLVGAGGSGNIVAYCFAEIPGFSKFGSYTGTFTNDGPFVYTGFRPKFVMIKASGDTGSWNIIDSTRNTSNVENARLFPNLSNAENTATVADFLANGFKIRSSDSDFNYTVQNIYVAFAENPFKNALAR